jgi:hypothetical protein
MKTLRIAFVALALLGAIVALGAGGSRNGNVVVASDGGTPLPPHGGGK